MTSGQVDQQTNNRVRAALTAVGREIVLPRWRNLRDGDIRDKGGGDPVTLADLEAEAALRDRLCEILPGSAFIGEEAVGEDPALLDLLHKEAPVWVVDPIDGTKNFAEGTERFCVMAALVSGGLTLGGWIYSPLEDKDILGNSRRRRLRE